MSSAIDLDPTLGRGRGTSTGNSAAESWKHAAFAALAAQGLLWLAVSTLRGGDLELGPLFALPGGVASPPLGAALYGLSLPDPVTLPLRVLLLGLASGIVHRLTRLDHPSVAAAQSAWLVALSPVGVALCADLAFGAALVGAAGALLAARSNRYGLAGVLAAIATLSSPHAGVIWLGVVVELFRQRAWRSSPTGALVAALLPAVAVLGWALAAGRASIDAVPSAVSAALVGRPDWGPVWSTTERLRAVAVLGAAVVTVVGALSIGKARRVRPSVVAVAVGMVCTGVLAGTPEGLVHASALAFPLPILLGVEMSHRPALEPAVVAACALSSLCLYLM